MAEFKMTELKRLLKRDWIYLLGIGLIFVLSILAGRILPQYNPKLAKLIEKNSLSFFNEMYGFLKGKSYFDWVIAIWSNNLKAAGAMIVVGVLPFMSLTSLIYNGLIIGVLERTTLTKAGASPFQVYISLVPHGIFELTAIFIAVYVGIRFGLVPLRLLWNFFRNGEYKPVLMEFLKESVYYLGMIIILLFVAALIESSAILIKV